MKIEEEADVRQSGEVKIEEGKLEEIQKEENKNDISIFHESTIIKYTERKL